MHALVLGVRFLSELAALVAFGAWGVDALGWAGLAVPVAAAVVWGVFMAPKSSRRLADPARLVAEVVFFGLAAAGLAAAGAVAAAIVFAVVALSCALLVRYFGEATDAA